MIKIIKICILSIGWVLGMHAQQIDYAQELPQDLSIKKGVLENGMTYYLHSTDVTENVASYYIIQNVGSILENDDQQGLAHFLEHMAFNGTESFAGKGILETFQKHGLVFGRDINAYTSFDETVYNINNIPTTPELIDTGLQVLRDWANYLLLTEEEIDAERGVIKEEWRTRQSGQMRILEQTIGTMFNNSKYADRLPIGLMDIVENFDYKALRDFYFNWYRTDLQAIAIVGDFDIAEMEQKIQAKFSKILAMKNPLERIIVTIPDNDKMLFKMAMDPEISTSAISFSIRQPNSLENKTVAHLKESLLDAMISTMFSGRLREVSQQPDAPFLGAYLGMSGMTRMNKAFNVQINPKPAMQEAAFERALTEVYKAVKFGFTQAEIDRTIAQLSNSYENQIEKVNDRSHKTIIKTIQNNYLQNEALLSISDEYAIVKVIFEELEAEEIHNRLKAIYTKKNRSLIITGVEGRENLTEEVALAIINKVETDQNVAAYSDDFAGKTLLSDLELNKGRIAAITHNEEIGSTTYSLSNGIKVHYKFTDKNQNSVQLSAYSEGGKSLISDEDLPSATLLGNLIQTSGLGDYSATELQKVMAGKSASAKVSINDLSEVVNGSSVTKDVETMLQLVHLRFVKPRFDEQDYEVLQGGIKNYLIQKSKNLKSIMQDSVTVTLYGENNSQKRIINEQFVNEISFDKMVQVYKDRFNNAADFEFFIIGDVKENDLKPLLAKYIASIPTNTNMEEWKDNTVNWLNSAIDKDIYLEMENPKSTVQVATKKKMDYNLKNYYTARLLGDVLQLRYTESLREEEGGTYGASVRASLSKRPYGQVSVQVMFDCNPDKVDYLVGIVHKEISKIKNGDIQQVDIDKSLTNYLKAREEQKNYNSYEMNVLKNYFLEEYNMNTKDNFENIINSLTAKDLQSFTEELFRDAASYEIVFKPKK